VLNFKAAHGLSLFLEPKHIRKPDQLENWCNLVASVANTEKSQRYLLNYCLFSHFWQFRPLFVSHKSSEKQKRSRLWS